MKKTVVLFLMMLMCVGCAGTTTAVSKRKLDVENKMSSTIFLEPVPETSRTVYVQVRNTSDHSGLDLQNQVVSALRMKGYQVVNDPKKAHYWLQANVLSVGQIDKQSREQMIESGFGGGIVGGALGAGTGVLVSGHKDAVIGGALAGAALGMLIDATIKDVTYGITTDVQISERTKNTVRTRNDSTLNQGTSGSIHVSSSGTDHWNRYQTRIISTANKANLRLDQALPDLTDGMSRSIAGIF